MSEPYLGSILYFAGNFAIRGYMTCQGQILAISQNSALFSILGTTYGGNGQSTFGLPDLRGRSPVGQGQGSGLQSYQLGQVGGTETVTLNAANMPAHNHPATFSGSGSMNASTAKATQQAPAAGAFIARGVDNVGTAIPLIYEPNGASTVALGGLNVAGTVTVGVNGSNVPFDNRDPYLTLNPLIAVQGLFPSRN